MDEREIREGAEALGQQYPELAEEANAIHLVGTAREIAEELGRPDLADDPRFWASSTPLRGTSVRTLAARSAARLPARATSSWTCSRAARRARGY
jgi:hypothetical protein